jgi:uncharacterized protein YbaR (Trm112 family)
LVDDELLKILICPNCKGEIEYRKDEEVIACVGECKYEYPVVDGIPHMLIEEARKPK